MGYEIALGWLFGKAADLAISKFGQKHIETCLNNWCSRVEEYGLSVMPESLASCPFEPFESEKPLLLELLEMENLPDESDFATALIGRWEYVRRTASNPTTFYTADKHIAKPLLCELAKELRKAHYVSHSKIQQLKDLESHDRLKKLEESIETNFSDSFFIKNLDDLADKIHKKIKSQSKKNTIEYETTLLSIADRKIAPSIWKDSAHSVLLQLISKLEPTSIKSEEFIAAQILISKNRIKDAITILEDLSDERKLLVIEAKITEAELAFIQCDYAHCKNLTGQLIDKYGGNYKLHLLRGKASLEANDWTNASKELTLSLRFLNQSEYTISQKIELLCKIGDADYYSGKTKSANQFFLEAVELAQKKENSTQLGSALQRAALIDISNTRYESAISLLERAIFCHETDQNHDPKEYLSALTSLAEAMKRKNEILHSTNILEKALDYADHQLNSCHPETAKILNDIGVNIRDVRVAEKYFTRAYEIDKKVFGSEGSSISVRLHNLALIDIAYERYEDASLKLIKAVSIASRYFSDGHPESYENLKTLSDVRMLQGKAFEAIAIQTKVVDYSEKYYGTNHVSFALQKAALAELHQSSGNIDLAISCLECALPILLARLGEEDQQTVFYSNLYKQLEYNN